MKNGVIIFVFLIFISHLWGQNSEDPVRTSSIPVLIKWVDKLPGDFSFAKIWTYPEGIYQNEYGQISCDGFCPPEIEAMKDSTGRIYEDSLQAFYEIIDTTHQVHSIQCEARCYEYNGTDFMEVKRLDNGSFHCFTLMDIFNTLQPESGHSGRQLPGYHRIKQHKSSGQCSFLLHKRENLN